MPDVQAMLVNRMAAKPESLEIVNDEDVKMIGVSSIDSLFSNANIDEKGTGEESILARRRPDNSEGEKILLRKLMKVGLKRSKL